MFWRVHESKWKVASREVSAAWLSPWRSLELSPPEGVKRHAASQRKTSDLLVLRKERGDGAVHVCGTHHTGLRNVSAVAKDARQIGRCTSAEHGAGGTWASRRSARVPGRIPGRKPRR